MIRYPNGSKSLTAIAPKQEPKEKRVLASAANRGMDFEFDINQSNTYYRDNHRALITKRPTPINIVKVDYSRGAHIVDAYFETQSTTDYNGIYKGKYVDFEAKSCHSKTSFPLHNIYPHQIEHLSMVLEQGGIAFFLINLVLYDEVYLLDAKFIIEQYLHGKRKSITFQDLRKNGHLVPQGYAPRLDYLKTMDEVYFHEENS